MNVAVGTAPACGAAGVYLSFPSVIPTEPVGAAGRAPGCGAGGSDDASCVVVAGA